MEQARQQAEIVSKRPSSNQERRTPSFVGRMMNKARSMIGGLLFGAGSAAAAIAPSEASAQEFIMEGSAEIDATASVIIPDKVPRLAFGGHMRTMPMLSSEPAWVHGFTFMAGVEIPSWVGHLTMIGGPGIHVALEGDEGEAVGGFELSMIFHSSRLGFHGDFEMMLEDGQVHEVYGRSIWNFGQDGHGPLSLINELRGVTEDGTSTFITRFGVGIAPWEGHPFQWVITAGGGQVGNKGTGTVLVGIRMDGHVDVGGHDHSDHDEDYEDYEVHEDEHDESHDDHDGDHDDHDTHDHGDHDGHDH